MIVDIFKEVIQRRSSEVSMSDAWKLEQIHYVFHYMSGSSQDLLYRRWSSLKMTHYVSTVEWDIKSY